MLLQFIRTGADEAIIRVTGAPQGGRGLCSVGCGLAASLCCTPLHQADLAWEAEPASQ